MSFQHFRLGELAMSQPLPPHLMHHQPGSNGMQTDGQNDATTSTAASNSAGASSKAPYGAGDSEDGYTLVFPSLDAFHAWRAQEEETQIVEFVKGDTHGSKAVPPRFKDHTKLVCARHSRSGRKKYVKKHPERVRKVPSRKLEGQGCPASISFKTYFHSDEVRVCYVNQHSHEIGAANLPFTRRGRKAAAQNDKDRTRLGRLFRDGESSVTPAPSAGPTLQVQPQAPTFGSATSSLPHPFPNYSQPHNLPIPGSLSDHNQGLAVSQDRWERMSVLFNSIRDHARGFEYPGPSVVALESVLIRLYLESPVGQVAPPALPGGAQIVPMMTNHPTGNTSGSSSGSGSEG